MSTKTRGDALQSLIAAWHNLLFSRKLEVIPHNSEKITPIENRILMYIFSREHLTIRDLSTFLAIPNATLTNAIDRLEKKNIIKRSICADDKRTYNIELTGDGISLLEDYSRKETAVWKNILQALDSDEQREQFIKMIVTISEKLTGDK